MNFNACIENVSTFTDLKRFANEYVIDYKRLSFDELKAAVIKTAPQYSNDDNIQKVVRFLYKGIIINHNKKPSQPTLKRRFFKKKAAFFHGPVWERSGADFILKRKGEFF